MLDVPRPVFPDRQMTAGILADWIEAYSLAKEGKVTHGDISKVLDRESESNADALLASAWLELRSRARVYGESWPITLGQDFIEPAGRDEQHRLFHYFLCILSLESGFDTEGRDLFELCVAEVLPALGPRISFRVGYPKRDDWPVGVPNLSRLPEKLDASIKLYARVTGETYQAAPPPKKKDLKVDVVAWRPITDRRGGWLHMLGQCTAQIGWRTSGKLSDINLKTLSRYIHWSVDPVRFFAIPYSAATLSTMLWKEACDAGGIILDRLRLLELHRDSPISTATAALVRSYSKATY